MLDALLTQPRDSDSCKRKCHQKCITNTQMFIKIAKIHCTAKYSSRSTPIYSLLVYMPNFMLWFEYFFLAFDTGGVKGSVRITYFENPEKQLI